jgi:hypothetical protein
VSPIQAHVSSTCKAGKSPPPPTDCPIAEQWTRNDAERTNGDDSGPVAPLGNTFLFAQ